MIERFEAKYIRSSPDACWEWQASKWNRGYGKIRVNGRYEAAHRLSYTLYVGEIPDGLLVLHECDNPSCVNPGHLFLGTHADNMRDMAEKGRGFFKKSMFPTRESIQRRPRRKLSDEDVQSIISQCDSGTRTKADIARDFGVTRSWVSNLYRREIASSTKTPSR